MKFFLKVTAGVFIVAFLTVFSLYWKGQAELEQHETYEEVLKLLKPLSWARPSALASQDQGFLLRGNAPFQSIVSSPLENKLFDFDTNQFLHAEGAMTFRQAQLGYFSRMSSDPLLNRYFYEVPHPRSWGALPYPPVREISQVKRESILPSDQWANDPAYQLELDRITGHELTKNQSVDVVQNGSAIEPILKVIRNSQQFVYINVLSLVCDASTEPVIHLLEERAQSGVDVRIILNRGYASLSRACLQRMRGHQIQIVTAPTHSSYYVNDQDQVVLGAESMARMFFESDGYNFLDRDLMLAVKGPIATDVIKNFISVWDKNRSDDLRDVRAPVSFYLGKRASEFARDLRARDYEGWSLSSEKNLCRFAEQMPNGEERSMENLLVSLASKSQRKILLSGVKFDADSPWFKASLARAGSGVDFKYLGNGWEGGDGELTLYLDELIRSHPTLAPLLRTLRNWDVDRIARKRAHTSAPLAGLPHVQLWSFFSFIHYKLALFDQQGVWVGSANPDRDSVTGYDESGIFCMDKELSRKLGDTTEIDLSNSVPVNIMPVK